MPGFAARGPRWLPGLSKSLGSAYEGHEERDRGDSGNRATDERAKHRAISSTKRNHFITRPRCVPCVNMPKSDVTTGIVGRQDAVPRVDGALRLHRERKLVDGPEYQKPFADLETSRIILKKYEIAKDRKFREPIRMQRHPPNNDASDYYTHGFGRIAWVADQGAW